jgi:glutamate-1-semialdehyde aminotransferase
MVRGHGCRVWDADGNEHVAYAPHDRDAMRTGDPIE